MPARTTTCQPRFTREKQVCCVNPRGVSAARTLTCISRFLACDVIVYFLPTRDEFYNFIK